ncbi:MAG: pyruvate dehydrogenase (acetyl-transferring), homodimeric type [Acidobacteria bacterium]|nr:pyruvate dehydrogenase (acetyl-transferring), homodimeric type [Acidobacteriota bacterium]
MIQGKIREDVDPQETSEWLEALDQVAEEGGPDRVNYLLGKLQERAYESGVTLEGRGSTPYINTIPVDEEVPYPGDREIERRIKSIIRWNAMAMVVRANKYDEGIGGHISTYQSLATLVEVGYNHFFRGSIDGEPGDFVYFQGHASPGMYARAFVEGRLSEEHLKNFRHELREHPGLSSYPHPWLMPDFWQFPTVSMGLGPINSIYHARFMRYLENRGLLKATDRKIWAFVGDGESDEPETLGALTLASREKLDNLVWVVNCNLQRLDGPVRGNGKIVQELEGAFRGAGWNVIKCLWGSDWDDLLARDTTGLLRRRMEECVDGEYQRFKGLGGAVIRKEFFGKYPELLPLVEDKTDEELGRLRRGGHDAQKVYNAYRRAILHKGGPTVILAKTVKGYGLGEAGEGKNITHQQKKLNENELETFRKRFDIPVQDSAVQNIEFYRPAEDSEEMQYMQSRREVLGGVNPKREVKPTGITAPPLTQFKDSLGGSRGREVSTTMAFVAILKNLISDKEIGKLIVPIIPDEARTFGMDSLFRTNGIYASQGQLYKPVDSEMLLYYKEAKDGQILEEGITEAGSMASFTAAGTAYANYQVPTIPFFVYYSMFGFQRIGDQIWAFADSRGKGFLCGGTAGRTTLNGEGLQHQDGHSLLHASTVPNCVAYDPTFAYEIAVVIQDGIRRMYQEGEDVFYYLTLENDNYEHPEMPEGVAEGILKGAYKVRAAEKGKAVAHLWGSGAILPEALKAQKILAEQFDVPVDVYSVTSYTELRRDCLEAERWNRLHPTEKPRKSYLQQLFDKVEGPIIASSDYMKALPDGLAAFLPGRIESLGTDGFGRSEDRPHLRRFFEVGAEAVAAATLSRLARDGKFDKRKIKKAFQALNIDTEAPNPARV